MALFKKAEPEPPQGGGKDLVRAMVKARMRTPTAISLLKEEMHLSSGMIESFYGGADNLTPAQIDAILAYFGWNASYDPGRDLLVSKGGPTLPAAVRPELVQGKPVTPDMLYPHDKYFYPRAEGAGNKPRPGWA